MLYILFFFTLWAGSFAAWLNHVITCIQNETWGFLVAGAIFFPIGVIHGAGLWLGIF
jgi:hypothetical protein